MSKPVLVLTLTPSLFRRRVKRRELRFEFRRFSLNEIRMGGASTCHRDRERVADKLMVELHVIDGSGLNNLYVRIVLFKMGWKGKLGESIPCSSRSNKASGHTQ